MNKKLNAVICFCFALFMLSSCSSEKVEPKSHLSEIGVTENVKAIKVSRYTSLANFKDKLGLSEVTHFNDKGNKEKTSLYNGDGSLSQKTVFTYNDEQYLEKEVSTDANNKSTGEIRYNYDKKGRLLTINYPKKGAFYTKLKYEYDKNNNKSKELSYMPNAKLDTQAAYSYNKQNQLIEENWLYADGALFYTIKTQYADSGKKKSEARYRANGGLFLSIRYNDKGDPVTVAEYDPNSKSEIRVSTAMVKHEYEYDEAGNWILQKTLKNGRPSSVIIREFKY